MFNLDYITNEHNEEHNFKWPYIPDHPYRMLISEPKYQFLIKKREDVGIKHLNDPKAFTEYSQCIDDVYNTIDDYNPSRKRKILIVFDDIIADIMTNKKFQATIKELFIRFYFYQTILLTKRSQTKLYTLLNNEDS